MRMRWMLAAMLVAPFVATTLQAKEHGERKRLTLQEAIADAESALDNGRLGDAFDESERLQKTHGLKKDEQERVDLIAGRCALARGNYALADKLLARRYKAAPDDVRVAEWYGRALDGAGKSDQAFGILEPLAQKDELKEGDSYWALAQLEHKKGSDDAARTHAKLALEKPIVLSSQQLDDEIHAFIKQLEPKKK
jgi:predicted Zn-dependent protease